MKRSILLLSLFFIWTGLAYSQSITLTSPHTGDNWEKGSTYNITWTKTGRMDANVKIRLYNSTGTTKILDISNNAPNNGSYSWPIPGSITIGNFVVRVKTLDNAISDDSDIFNISERMTREVPTIHINNPRSGSSWHKGLSYNIEWSKTGSMDPNVKIRLYDSGGITKILDITNSTANDGSFPWTIPGSIANGSYRVRVKTSDNAVSADSDIFSISELTLREVSTIHISSPASGNKWCKGQAYTIQWSKSGLMDENVSINLINADTMALTKSITDNTPNDGNFPITASALNDVSPANYLIRIITLDNNVRDDSDIFRISDCPTLTLVPGTKFRTPPITPFNPELFNAELSIEQITRTDNKPVRKGEILGFRVRVKNTGRRSANICIATPNGDKSQNFYSRGECGVINSGVERSYSINIPVPRSYRGKINVFLIKAAATGLLGNVLWKDGNSRNNFKTVNYPLSLPDLVITEISEVRYGAVTNVRWHWTSVLVKVKNKGNYASQPCKITLQGFSTSSRSNRYPCGSPGRKIINVPAIPSGRTITGFLHTTCGELGKPRNEYDIEVFINPESVPNRIKESDYTNNKLKVNITRLNTVNNNTPPSSWDTVWTTISLIRGGKTRR